MIRSGYTGYIADTMGQGKNSNKSTKIKCAVCNAYVIQFIDCHDLDTELKTHKSFPHHLLRHL